MAKLQDNSPIEFDFSHKIKKFQKSYLKDCLKISAEGFGENYLNESSFVEEKNIIYCAIFNNCVIGFIIGSTDSIENLSIYTKNKINLNIQDENFNIIKYIAIEKNSQNTGIGSKLFKKMLKHFKKNTQNRYTLMIGWAEKEHPARMSRISQKYDFQEMGMIEDYWTEESKELGYSCAICRKVCQCTAYLYLNVQKPITLI